jgi:hypothetical protein
MTPAPTRPRASRRGCVDVASFLEALDSAMFAWAMRANEHPQLVERKLDTLHDAWASMRRTSGDAFEQLVSTAAAEAARPPAPPMSKLAAVHGRATGTGKPAYEARRTTRARAKKAVIDGRRIAFIVKHYHIELTKGRSPKASRERVAAWVRRGLHLTPSMRARSKGTGDDATYSQESVARVLRKFESR